jgi:hypothetical protein
MNNSGMPGGPGDNNIEYDCFSSCHHIDRGGSLSASTISMSTNNSNPEAGTPVFVNVTVENSEQKNGEAISVLLIRALRFVDSQPSVSGWTIIRDPNGGINNSVQRTVDDTGSATFSWQLETPRAPGQYRLYAREHHGDGTNTPYFNDFTPGITFDVFSLIKIIKTELHSVIPEIIKQDRGTTLSFTLIDEFDNRITDALVTVFTPTTYGLLKIGENITDSEGNISIDYEFQYSGRVEVIAKYRGGPELNASEASFLINVEKTWVPPEEGGGLISKSLLLGTVLGGVWTVYAYVFYMFYRASNPLKRTEEFLEPDEKMEGNKSK